MSGGRTGRLGVVAALAVLGAHVAARAEEGPPAPPADDANAHPGEIVVYGRAIRQIGVALSGSEGTVGYQDFADRPMARVGELVENVPGMIATQHSGSGKANQYFLRGFNLDHGTDFAGFVDGVPINMRTHGHGQGYLDLNFLIPELVERIDYRKGPYFADVGDFSAAGTARFTLARTLPRPLIQVTGGSYDYARALAAGSAPVGSDELLLAIDGTVSNGPWTLAERLRKINALATLSHDEGDKGWSLTASAYHATWHSTDQVPQRAIAGGLIGRFGNIDPYLGGETTRIGLTGNGHIGATSLTLYALYYRFALTSNFTYYLDDPVNGDEFRQRDQRGVFGGTLRRDLDVTLAGVPVAITVGADARYDHIGLIGLYHTLHARVIGTVRQDHVDEESGALYAQAVASPTDRLRLTLGLRGDLVGYDVGAETLAANSGRGDAHLVEPKAALAWRATDHLELYADAGDSYHSNDVRGATIRIDPKSGDPATRVPVLVRGRGEEIGARIEYPSFSASLVGYHLALGSELVFSGDEGSTEPNAASRRDGIEATLFWRPTGWLTLDGAVAATHARFHGVAAGERHIPNSVSNVIAGGAEIALGHGLTGSLRLRHFGPAPLIEDDSARSHATTLVNLGTYWQRGRVKLGVDILNLLDARDNDITYFYASRLPGEPAAGIDDDHLHPVEPREARVSLRYQF